MHASTASAASSTPGASAASGAPTALIFGITGQDGSYLAELLLEKGYRVTGMVRRVALEDKEHRLSRIAHLLDRIELMPGSLESYPSIYKCMLAIKPDEVYNLAAQSFVGYSFDDQFSTLQNNTAGAHFVLSAVAEACPKARFYFAATSEMFGMAKVVPQNEQTLFHPRSVYGISKVAGYHLTQYYREAHHLFACNGIMYNHESPRRGYEFVTRKITSHAARIKLGQLNRLELGNLDTLRDWGHAKDYVRAMWLMLQHHTPDDFVIATGVCHSVREVCDIAFGHLGLDYRDYVHVNPSFFRPTEPGALRGDASKARRELGWEPGISLKEMLVEMVEHDLAVYGHALAGQP
ncbi:GDP-mannose 4,6-dehydratase [Megalodesulfovibrio paquesii]